MAAVVADQMWGDVLTSRLSCSNFPSSQTFLPFNINNFVACLLFSVHSSTTSSENIYKHYISA